MDQVIGTAWLKYYAFFAAFLKKNFELDYKPPNARLLLYAMHDVK